MLTFNFDYFLGLFPRLATAIPYTAEVIAVIRIARIPVLHQFCEIWLSYNRSMPFILDLYLVYFVLPVIIRGLGISPDGWPLTAYVLIALTFHYSPVISEIIRPAYLSVDKGQSEVAVVFGLSPFHRVFRIVAPQAFPVALPNLVSEAINIMKDTSVMYFIGVIDLMGRAGNIINANYGQGKLETYCAVALIYWVLVIFVEMVFHAIQRMTDKGRRTT